MDPDGFSQTAKPDKPIGRLLYPAHGLKMDVEKILHDFGACQSLRYSDFTATWRKLNFSVIHAGRSGNREKREFVEEAFKLIVKYALVPYTLQVRVGAMYLLYGIYNTQRGKPLVRIKIQLTDWPDMLTLHEELISSGHTDADYIFRKMRDVDQVFCLVASTSTHCREDLYYDKDYFVLEDDTQDPFVKIHFAPLTSVMDYDCLSVLQTIHTEYKTGKDLYKADPANQSNSLLNLVENDVIAKIIKLRGEDHNEGSLPRKKKVKPTKGKRNKVNQGMNRKEIKRQADQAFETRMKELGGWSSSDFDESPPLRPHNKLKRASKDHGAARRQLKEKAFSQSTSTSAKGSVQPNSMLVEGAALVPVNEESKSSSDDSLWEPYVPQQPPRRRRIRGRKKKVAVAAKTPTKSAAPKRQSRKAKESAAQKLQHIIVEEDNVEDDANSEHSPPETIDYRFGSMNKF